MFRSVTTANAAEVQSWLTKLDDTLVALRVETSLLDVLSAVAKLVFESCSGNFWQNPVADLKNATQAIAQDVSSRLDVIKNEIEACTS